MAAQTKNPGLPPRESHAMQYGHISHSSSKVSDWRAQLQEPELWKVAKQDFHFLDHRQAALALLIDNHKLSRKAGQFLGQLAVDTSPLSLAQAQWVKSLLNRAGLPPMVEGDSL